MYTRTVGRAREGREAVDEPAIKTGHLSYRWEALEEVRKLEGWNLWGGGGGKVLVR